ncbi:MAG: hypothetical protein LIP16_16235 [Clostridium sp.]|nr:hypothetical protein [Clostridium sp.]
MYVHRRRWNSAFLHASDAGWFDAGEQGRKEAGNAYVTEEGLVRLTELVLDHYNNDYILNRRL